MIALVAGARSSTGSAVAVRLRSDGAAVHTVSGRELRSASDPTGRRGATAAVAEAGRLDLLVNVATLTSFTRDAAVRDIDLDVCAMFEISRAALGPLAESAGTLVNVVSDCPWESDGVRVMEAAMAQVADALARDAGATIRIQTVRSGRDSSERIAETVARLAMSVRPAPARPGARRTWSAGDHAPTRRCASR